MHYKVHARDGGRDRPGIPKVADGDLDAQVLQQGRARGLARESSHLVSLLDQAPREPSPKEARSASY
jgi:hypothetical protein